MRTIDYRSAIFEALDEELARDERVVLYGEDVAAAGGVFQVTAGLLAKHGPARVFDTPISELALAGSAFGSAVTGLRPVVEIMFGDFLTLAMDSLVNQAAKYRYLSNAQASVPLVVRSTLGAGGRFGAIHSQSPIPWFQSVSGLKIVCPATVADAKGLLKASIRDDDPVLFLEHKRLYAAKGALPDGDDHVVPIGKASVVRDGRDLTIVTAMKGVHDALEAAETLAADGIDVEVVDLRSIRPLDHEAVLDSVGKTGRILAVEEGPPTGGWSPDVLCLVTEEALGYLDEAWRLTTPDHPIPYSPTLEDAFVPGASAIVDTVRARLG